MFSIEKFYQSEMIGWLQTLKLEKLKMQRNKTANSKRLVIKIRGCYRHTHTHRLRYTCGMLCGQMCIIGSCVQHDTNRPLLSRMFVYWLFGSFSSPFFLHQIFFHFLVAPSLHLFQFDFDFSHASECISSSLGSQATRWNSNMYRHIIVNLNTKFFFSIRSLDGWLVCSVVLCSRYV